MSFPLARSGVSSLLVEERFHPWQARAFVDERSLRERAFSANEVNSSRKRGKETKRFPLWLAPGVLHRRARS